MSIMQQAVEGPGYRLIKGRRGPLTAARQARALIVLALVYAVGLGLFWGVEAAGWRAFGRAAASSRWAAGCRPCFR
jgi:hypothetical protein